MPPKQAHADDEDNYGVDPDSLDRRYRKNAFGGNLTTLRGYAEEDLPDATKLERVRERTRLLDACVLPEQVRRMCRRAGVSMHQTTAPENEHNLVQVLQRICDVYLFNVCKEVCRICEHLRKKTITEEILREALKSFNLKLFGPCEHRHEICRTMINHRSDTGNDDWRGSEAEIFHERNINAGTCVYFGHAAFLKLLRLYLSEQSPVEPPLKTTPGVISCIQLSMESELISLLESARFMVRRTTKKKSEDSSPRNKLTGRDLETAFFVQAPKHAILRGNPRALGNTARRRRSPSRSPSPRAKAKPKARAGPGRAKASARLKRS